MQISGQFQTSLDSPEHIAVSERLGYDRAWLQDTPAHSQDVWMMPALAARRTERIGLGPGVLVPTLRHPMVNASGCRSRRSARDRFSLRHRIRGRRRRGPWALFWGRPRWLSFWYRSRDWDAIWTAIPSQLWAP
jgi:hypothetical protein